MVEDYSFVPPLVPGPGGCTAEDIVTTAQLFRADVLLRWEGGQEASAKSLLEVLELCSQRPRELTIATRGADAEEAMQAVMDLCGSGILECHHQVELDGAAKRDFPGRGV